MSKKPDCSDHPTTVEGYDGRMLELAEAISNLRYDKLDRLFNNIAVMVEADALKDREGGRPKLANNLEACSNMLRMASMDAGKAWITCKPYMK